METKTYRKKYKLRAVGANIPTTLYDNFKAIIERDKETTRYVSMSSIIEKFIIDFVMERGKK